MFPGLQSRYPAAHADDEEATYVRRDAMTAKDVTFNVRRLRREGKTKIGRADALEAWWEIKQAAAAVPPAAREGVGIGSTVPTAASPLACQRSSSCKRSC